MIESSIWAWAMFIGLCLLATASGAALSACMPWSAASRQVGLDKAAGFVFAPFLAGLASVGALGLFPGSSRLIHLAAVATALAALTLLLARWRHPSVGFARSVPTPLDWVERVLAGLVLAWAIALLINSVFLPLMENDALEYATVGRLLFETADLRSYPAIDPESSRSGFFGPWTHPPLYPALTYLTQIIQGHAEQPGLMRMIAPWFALGTTALVYGIGRTVNRGTGWAGALLFLSTHLYFSGANTASIDALPVAGFALVAALVPGLAAQARWRGAWIGVALGFALWTHSQAILLLPLAAAALLLHQGVVGWRSWTRTTAAMLLMAFLIGAWPYWRNFGTFGAFVSDNPAVFAMRSLAWKEYFLASAGLDNWAGVIQYGLLKGWFAGRSFGWTFWLAAGGAILLMARARAQPGWRGVVMQGAGAQDLAPFWTCLAMVATYLAGTALSVLMKMDLMIKNDRYLLVLLPMAAVLAGFGAHWMLRWLIALQSPEREAAVSRVSARVVLGSVAILCLAQLLVVGGYFRWRVAPAGAAPDLFAVGSDAGNHRQQRILAGVPHMQAPLWIAASLPADALVLSLRPADMYYARRKMISYLDPRMLDVYAQTDPRAAAQMLRRMGVTHVHATEYALPVYYNTVLIRLVNDPSLAQLEFGISGAQVYALRDSGLGVKSRQVLTPGAIPWTSWGSLGIPVAARLASLFGSARLISDNQVQSTQALVPIGQRDFSTWLASGVGMPLDSPGLSGLVPVEAGHEYVLRMLLSGQSFVRIHLRQFDAQGQPLAANPGAGADRIGEIVLREESGEREFARRFVTLPGARYVRFGLERMGYSSLRLQRAEIETLAPRDSRSAQMLEKKS